MQVASKIGHLKLQGEQTVVDPDRERRMLGQRRRWARTLGLDDKLVEELFALIMRHSKQAQAELASD